MKNHIQVIITFFFAVTLSFRTLAETPLTPDSYETAYKHLVEINSDWKNFAGYAPQNTVNFKTDVDRISAHLNLVIQHLSTHPPVNLTANQKANRIHLLDMLSSYADKKVFTINTAYNHRQPCFVDEKETHCAVGYMMAISGHTNLVEEIRATSNYAYLEDIKTAGVVEWAQEFGFTLDELRWIQPGYAASEQYDPVGEGTNGEVKILEKMTWFGDFLVAGTFTELNGLPCLNIGYYNDEHLSCLGDGIAGTINDVYSKDGEHFVFGRFEHEGTIYPMASYTDETWIYYSIPTRVGATASAGSEGPYFGGHIQLAISHPDIEVQEIWFLSESGEWSKKATITGIIYDISRYNFDFAYAGCFSSVITIDGDDGFDVDFANNLLIYDTSELEWIGINQPTSDTIKCLTYQGSALYLGGSASEYTESDICLGRYYLGVVSPLCLLSAFNTADYVSINDMTSTIDSKLLIAGDFKVVHEFGDWGDNLATYDIALNNLHTVSNIKKSISSVYRKHQDIFIGGKFTESAGIALNHLAKQRRFASDVEHTEMAMFEVFPNPFIDEIKVKSGVEIHTFMIHNQAGQIVKQGSVENHSIQELGDLPKGVYFITLRNNDQEWKVKLVK